MMREVLKQSLTAVLTFFLTAFLILIILFLIYKYIIVPIDFIKIIQDSIIKAITG